MEWLDQGNVGMVSSPFTGEQQIYRWPNQFWSAQVTLAPMTTQAIIGPWVAFFLSLNGCEGTFYWGDSVRKNSAGSISGSVSVAAGATANSTTLPITGGSGVFAVGDWIQVGTGSTSRLHRVLKVNGGSVDVFPRLRSAYASGLGITYTAPVGVFRIVNRVGLAFDERKIVSGLAFSIVEAL